jgi:hypothetical protein
VLEELPAGAGSGAGWGAGSSGAEALPRPASPLGDAAVEAPADDETGGVAAEPAFPMGVARKLDGCTPVPVGEQQPLKDEGCAEGAPGMPKAAQPAVLEAGEASAETAPA